MKKLFLFIAAVVIFAGCSNKESSDENVLDKWNGYAEFYKAGEMYKDLRIKGDVVGQVTYGIDDDANFYVTYETDADWEIVKTHLFAGEWRQKPRNRRGSPKRFRFPLKSTYSPYVTTCTYTIPLVDLPPAEEPGFVVATHALVYNPNKCDDGGYRHAWADWDRRFSCRSWGGYSIYYYNEPYDPHAILYGLDNSDDGGFSLYLIDATDGTSEEIYYDEGEVGVTYGGAAYDPTNGYLLYTGTYFDANGDEISDLFVNHMDSTDSYLLGTLDGIANSGSFLDGSYYYVDESDNSIMEVAITGTDPYTISETTLTTITDTIVDVNDIVYEPNGDVIYIIGVNDLDEVLFVEFDVAADQYATITFEESPPSDAELAYGDDGNLYVVSGNLGGGGSIIGIIQPQAGIVNPIDEADIGEIGDLIGGPLK